MSKLAAILMIMVSFCACARKSGTEPVLPAGALPVPVVRQATGYTCGAAALLAVLYYWRAYEGTESGLLDVTGTSRTEGAKPQGLVKGAQQYGLNAYYKEKVYTEDLRKALDRGETVILDLQAWPKDQPELPWAKRRESGHYMVLTALDGNYAYFMDPAVGTGYTYIPLAELPERWHDYENMEKGVWENERLAIFVSGKKPLKKFPSELVPTR